MDRFGRQSKSLGAKAERKTWKGVQRSRHAAWRRLLDKGGHELEAVNAEFNHVEQVEVEEPSEHLERHARASRHRGMREHQSTREHRGDES